MTKTASVVFCYKTAKMGGCDRVCNATCRSKARDIDALKLAKLSGTAPSRYSICKRLIELDRGYGCEIDDCPSPTTWKNQPVLLILDHIDGNAANHIWNNLRTVCSNCDAQLPTYKARNRTKGRAFRRERYAQGLTY